MEPVVLFLLCPAAPTAACKFLIDGFEVFRFVVKRFEIEASRYGKSALVADVVAHMSGVVDDGAVLPVVAGVVAGGKGYPVERRHDVERHVEGSAEILLVIPRCAEVAQAVFQRIFP